MKKSLTIFIFLVLCGYCFAEETDINESERNEFIFGLDTGILGIGISYGTGNIFSFDFNANLPNLYIENITTGLGIEFFPFNYSYSINLNEHKLSFLKLYLYWNIDKIFKLDIDSGNDYKDSLVTLGPFFSIQTLNLNNFQNFNTNISYSAGIKFARKSPTKAGKFNISGLSSNIELGYNYNNRHNIYFTIGLSPAYTLFLPLSYIFLAINGIGD
jgi:hypothetical protein